MTTTRSSGDPEVVPPEAVPPGTEGRVLVAARLGTTRLIDNLPLVLGAAGGATAAR